MEDLDKTLDIMERDKCTSLLAENAVRLKKNNIKFTKTNKKHSDEHLEAQFVSYERLIRTLIKGFVTIEKKVRLKYMVPLESVRANKLKASWNTEVECILEDLKKKYRDVHLQRRSVEEFDGRVSQSLDAAKISVDTEVSNLEQKLKTEIEGSEKIQPSELSRLYDLDVTALIDLQVIDPLQNLQILCKKLKDSGCDGGALTPVNEIIKMYVKEIKSVEATVWSGRSADQRKEIKMRAAKLNLNLKEIVLCLHDLVKQAILEKEKRNDDVILKIRKNLDKIFKSETDSALFQNVLEPFWGILA
ncbi:MAG: hypothetical protein H8E42_07515 [Nitrospinae bacterium]|nr:hypothetical protein [Nitrospinota bacterium]MBL7019114.1 hypothetical protein [Nitrospinaceae bacterium]